MTIFAANGVAQTFDYQAGDISYVPAAYGEHIAKKCGRPLTFVHRSLC